MVLLIYDFSLKDNKGLSDRSAGLEKEENGYATCGKYQMQAAATS